MGKTVSLVPLKLEMIVNKTELDCETIKKIQFDNEHPYRIVMSTPDWEAMPPELATRTPEELGRKVYKEIPAIRLVSKRLGYADCELETLYEHDTTNLDNDYAIFYARQLTPDEIIEYCAGFQEAYLANPDR